MSPSRVVFSAATSSGQAPYFTTLSLIKVDCCIIGANGRGCVCFGGTDLVEHFIALLVCRCISLFGALRNFLNY